MTSGPTRCTNRVWTALAALALVTGRGGLAGSRAAAQEPGDVGAPGTARPVVVGLDLHTPALAGSVDPGVVDLGARLFADPVVSRDSTLACASCHRESHRFADPRPTSTGRGGLRGHRNAPSLLNTAYRTHLFWDGRAGSLEEAVLMPLRDFTELGLAPGVLVRRLDDDPMWRAAFVEAFGGPPTVPRVARALAEYVGSLRSGGTPLDHWLAGDGGRELSPEARRGWDLFRTRAGCASCHGGALLTDDDFHNTGVSWGEDPGRERTTGRSEDRGRFRTPSLRDVARTAPYMHDGSMATLEDVVDFYDRGGRPNPNLDPRLRPLGLTDEERRDLLAFLRSLDGTVVGLVPPPGG
ncbi:MAG: cytochrome c peroxidase [Longimicrobiales bacterium]